jgi:hypothetical protein
LAERETMEKMPTDTSRKADGLEMDCPRHGRVAVSKLWTAEGGCYACGLEAQAAEMGWSVPTPPAGYVDADGATPRSMPPVQGPARTDETARLRANVARLVGALEDMIDVAQQQHGGASDPQASSALARARAALAAAKQETKK